MIGLPANLEWRDGCLRILDQRALPRDVVYLTCRSSAQVAAAIRVLAVRGAPAIGIAGAYGVALAAEEMPVPSARFAEAVAEISNARPTASDLGWAVGVTATAAQRAVAQGRAPALAALEAAESIHRRDAARCAVISTLGAELLTGGSWVLTHCHTGALATGGEGTALGAIAVAHRRGLVDGVIVCEARPLWQGARLTAWECLARRIPCRVIADGAAAGLLAAGHMGAVLVGADRIAANGDTANKVGTYGLAALAHRHRVPFHVLAPWSSIDSRLASGACIPIEERDTSEVLAPAAAPGATAQNPAFDVTPGALIGAIVTETGIYRRPYGFAGHAEEAEFGA